MPTDRLYIGTPILDPTQPVEQAEATTHALEQACARICPDGSVEAQWRYDHLFVHALRN